MKVPQTLQEAGQLLGVEPPILRGSVSMADAAARVQKWKDDVLQAAWKREVRIWHPDRATSDEDRAKRNRMTQAINVARDILLEVKAKRIQPRPGLSMRVMVYGGPAGGSTYDPFGGQTSTTTGGSPFWWRH